MFCESSAALCGAGRAEGVRVAEGRFLTGRRSVGRMTGLGTTGFFAFAVFFATGLLVFVALRLADVLPLPDPFLDLPLAMLSFPLPRRRGALSHEGQGHSSLISSSFINVAKKTLSSATWRVNSGCD